MKNLNKKLIKNFKVQVKNIIEPIVPLDQATKINQVLEQLVDTTFHFLKLNENEVLLIELYLKGYTTNQVAEYMNKSSRMINSYKNSILEKLNAKTINEVIAMYVKLNSIGLHYNF